MCSAKKFETRILNHILKHKNNIKKPCLKQTVIALILAEDGSIIIGDNSIKNSVSSCPRDISGFKTGEGYHLCREVCNQNAHAEITAIIKAKSLNIPLCKARLFLYGHTYICDNCKFFLESVGISKSYIYKNNGFY